MSTQQIGFTRPKARTAHRCSLCDRTIDPGETYARHRMVGDDGPYVWKQCGHCSALLRVHGDDIVWDWHEGYSDEDVREWEPAGDAAALKAHWLAQWRDADGALYPLPATSPTPPPDAEEQR